MSIDGMSGQSTGRPASPPPADPARPRIGARVRALIGDGFVARGLTGRIVNRVPTAASVRVLWDNDTASVVRLAGLQLLDPESRPAGAV